MYVHIRVYNGAPATQQLTMSRWPVYIFIPILPAVPFFSQIKQQRIIKSSQILADKIPASTASHQHPASIKGLMEANPNKKKRHKKYKQQRHRQIEIQSHVQQRQTKIKSRCHIHPASIKGSMEQVEDPDRRVNLTDTAPAGRKSQTHRCIIIFVSFLSDTSLSLSFLY